MRSRLAPAREQEIIEIAEAVADFYCGDTSICPLTIMKAESIDYAVGAYGEKSFEGVLEFSNGRFFIFCNRERGNDPSTSRGRFTLAHELGHYFIPEHRLALERGTPKHQSKCGLFDGQQVTEELEADLFAANLLMPPSRFGIALQKVKKHLPLAAILELKEIFKTSILSTAIQYAPYNPDVVAMMKWNTDALAWKRIQDDFFIRRQYRSWKLTVRADLPRGCATLLALSEQVEPSFSERHETTTVASACFQFVATGGARDLIMREEAIRLGSHGVLTLLSLDPKFK